MNNIDFTPRSQDFQNHRPRDHARKNFNRSVLEDDIGFGGIHNPAMTETGSIRD